LEIFLGHSPIIIVSDTLTRIHRLILGIHLVGLLFNMIKLIFIVISVLIIYSLLMITVEAKTFEVAVQRMVGLEAKGVMCLIIFQSFLYVIPALLLSFLLAIQILK